MKRFTAGFCALGSAAMMAWADPSAQYINNGHNETTPQINARVFINNGAFDVLGGGKPYVTQNTEVFLNSGVISANPGMRFELLDDAGVRRPATLFSNAPNATIIALDGTSVLNSLNTFQTAGGTFTLGQFLSFVSVRNTLNVYRSITDSFLTVNADELVNRGTITGSAGGEVRLEGGRVDLSRSAVDIPPLANAQNNFGNDVSNLPLPGQTDNYWHYDQGRMAYGNLFTLQTKTNVVLGATNVESRINAATPRFQIENVNTPVGGPYRNNSFTFPPNSLLGGPVLPFVWITTNGPVSVGPTNPATNQVITVLLVHRTDPNVLVDAVTSPGFDPINAPLPTVSLRFVAMSTNLITGKNDATVLRLDNTYGSDPNPLEMSNRISGNTYQPTNVFFGRSTVQNVPNPLSPLVAADTNLYNAAISNLYAQLQRSPFASMRGTATNSPLRKDIMTAWLGGGITNALTYTNNAATNPYVAYSGTFGFQATTVPSPANVPDASNTNLSGRIVINAKNLDLTRVRMRAQGPVIIKTDNLIGNGGASIDAPYVDADFGADNGLLNLTGLFRSEVERFAGTVQIYSSIWTNTVDYAFTVTNAPANPTDPPTTTDTTITLTSIFNIVYVDADLIPKLQTPFVDLKLHATNIVLGDQFIVSGLTAVDAETFTLNGTLEINGTDNGTFDWNAATFANLRRFTNNGALSVANDLIFGTDRALGYEVVVNNGSLLAADISVRSDLILTAPGSSVSTLSGPVTFGGTRAVLGGGKIVPATVFQLAVDEARFADAAPAGVTAVFVDLDVKNRIEAGANVMSFASQYGLSLASMPPIVTLTNVSISMTPPDFQEAVITWPGADNGPTPAAFDGHQIGQLLLDGGVSSTITFAPVGAKAALYVGFLSLSTNLVSTNSVTGNLVLSADLNVLPGMTVYFAAANVPGAQLELLTGGKFVQVSGLGGFAADVPTLVNGRKVGVARALRYSMSIDSDGDGIVNALDDSPFDGVVVKNAQVLTDGSPGFRITWEGAPGQGYEVQYTSGQSFGEWKPLERVTNDSPQNQTLWVRDPIPAGDAARAYRVVYQQ